MVRAEVPNAAQIRELFKKGTSHFNLGEYRQALADFKAAYRLHEDPNFLFNIAQCHRLLGEHTFSLVPGPVSLAIAARW